MCLTSSTLTVRLIFSPHFFLLGRRNLYDGWGTVPTGAAQVSADFAGRMIAGDGICCSSGSTGALICVGAEFELCRLF